MKGFLALGFALVSMTSICAQTAARAVSSANVSIDESTNSDTPTGDATDAQLRAWANRYIQKGTFVETNPFMHTNPANRIFLYDPTSVQKLGNAHVTAWFRIELFRSVVMQGTVRRSVHKKLEIDCSDLRYRELIIEDYSGANMQQRLPDSTFPQTFGKPEPADSPQGITAGRVCNDANALKR